MSEGYRPAASVREASKRHCGSVFPVHNWIANVTIGVALALGVSLAHAPSARADASWLRQPLSCDEVVARIQTRYAPFGGMANAPPSMKDDLKQILRAICSERFSHCNFHCPGTRARVRPSPEHTRMLAPGADRIRDAAIRELALIYRQHAKHGGPALRLRKSESKREAWSGESCKCPGKQENPRRRSRTPMLRRRPSRKGHG